MTTIHPRTLIAPVIRRQLDTGWTLAVASGPAPAEITGIRIPTAVPGVVPGRAARR